MIKEVGNFSQFWKSSKRNREASREQKIIFKINSYILTGVKFWNFVKLEGTVFSIWL
jgi:hypothetical protein